MSKPWTHRARTHGTGAARLAVVAGLVGALLVPAGAAAQEVGATGYEATIRRTGDGTAHVLADDLGGAAFGNGWAAAQDNVCIMADEFLTTRGTRSRWLGPDGGNLASDLYWARIADAGLVEQLVARGPDADVPGPSQQARELVRGFAAGYNAWLASVGGPDGISDPACAGAAWVTPITPLDMWRRSYQLSLYASGGNFVEALVAAAPPTGAGALGAAAVTPRDERAIERLQTAPEGLGSNAVALGADGTQAGTGLLLGNPHFPWVGSRRFWRVHLTVPGQVDVVGAALLGVPGVQIGHNADVGWSHTVSTGVRFTVAELQLGEDPTTYVVDGEQREMQSRDVEVLVADGEGGLSTVAHTFWESDHGPLLGGAPFAWSGSTAYALQDANADNLRHIDTWLSMWSATSARDLRDRIATHQGIPWVNTVAADRDGEAMYADLSVKPNVADEQLTSCVTSPLAQQVLATQGIPVLDGSRSACGWQVDDDAAVPGIIGPERLPVLFRDDWVANSNDSFWLSNPDEPLTGFPQVVGDVGTPRSLRTRLGIEMVQERLAGTAGDGTPGLTRGELQGMVFNNRVGGAELVLDDLLDACRAAGSTEVDGTEVDLAEACDVLAAWDREVELDSRGAHVFREFVLAGGIVFADDLDPDAPTSTPRQLDVDDPAVLRALGVAVQRLGAAGLPLDAPLGELQFEVRGEDRIPIHGGRSEAGVFNFIRGPLVDGVGYSPILHGSSFVMVAEFTDDGPRSRALLTYSQSSDPTSPWYRDQTELFSAKQWTEMRFDEAEVLDDPELVTTEVAQQDGTACADAPQPPFTDVDGPFADAVGCASDLGLVVGRADGTFGPSLDVTRGATARILVGLLEAAGVRVPTDAPDAFSDDDGGVFEDAHDRLSAAGVLTGYADGTVRGATTISRGEAAVLLDRVEQLAVGSDPLDVPDAFSDDDGGPFEPAIDRLAAAGIVQGVTAERFDGAARITRGQLAAVAVRLLQRAPAAP